MQIPYLRFEPQPLSDKNMELIMCMLQGAKAGKETPLEDSSLAKEFLSQVLLKRISAYQLPFSFTDFFLLASFVTFVDSPGNIMALLRLCWQHWQESGETEFNIHCWCSNLFPYGTPSESDLKIWWDSQKSENAPLGNLVDIAELWSSKRDG